MLTVFDKNRQNRETVYTAADGSFAIRTPFAGQLQVRARLAGLTTPPFPRLAANMRGRT